jgi:hypothetical protein
MALQAGLFHEPEKDYLHKHKKPKLLCNWKTKAYKRDYFMNPKRIAYTNIKNLNCCAIGILKLVGGIIS